jgi:iron complex outermembrane receptor protein
MLLRKLFLSTVSSIAMLSAGQQAAMAADKPASENANTVEEIVVTARKREESILDTPIAITAVTGEDLAAKGISSFVQLADSTPGVNLSNASAGAGRSDRSFQQITVRGFVPSTTLSTLTATFIDGVPVASPSAVASVNDPARVEILKGPQAAYFGRNTFAGAINVVNRLPGEEFGGSFSLMGGNRGNVDISGALDGPIVNEKFGFRIGAHYFKKDGSYNNPAQAGQTLGDQETRTITLLLTAKPTENFAAKLFTLYSEDDDGPSAQGYLSAYEVRAVNGAAVVTPPGTTSTAGTVIIPGNSNCTITGLRFGDGRAFGPLPTDEANVSRPFFCGALPSLSSGFSPAQNTLEDSLLAASLADPRQRVVAPSDGAQGYGLVRQYIHTHLNLDYTIGQSGFTLSSLTGLNAEYWSEVADLDNYDSRLLNNPSNPGNANPARRTFWDFVFGVERETYDFSQELRLSYDKEGPFTGVFGVSYLKTNVWNNLINISTEVLGQGNRDVLTSASKTPVKTQSLFFGTTYKFTDAFKLSLEGRYQQDEITGLASSSPMGVTVSAAGSATFGIPAGFYAPLSKIISKKYDNFLPRVIAQYDFNSNMMGYVSYSKGVNVGTNSINTAFLSLSPLGISKALELGLTVTLDPEEMTNYEVGFKGKFLDNRLQLQAAAYHAIWTNQLNNRSQTFLDPAIGNTAQQVSGLANTGESALNGVEVEVTARPSSHVDLNFAAALTDSSIRSYSTPSLSQFSGVIGAGFKGKQLPLSSKLSMNLGAQYSADVSAWEDGSWFVRADMSWKDKMFLDASNVNWIKARTVVNLRAGIKKGPLGVDVFVNNAFDDKNYVSAFTGTVLLPNFAPVAANGAQSYAITGMPELRTYGARVTYKF